MVVGATAAEYFLMKSPKRMPGFNGEKILTFRGTKIASAFELPLKRE